MLRALYGLLSSLPRILDLVTAGFAAISHWLEERRERKAREQLGRAIDQARETKDSCELERMFDPEKKCPPPSEGKP